MTEPERYPPLAHYGFLGDCHNWALVSRAGSVDWLCFERAGGHSVFARILDWDRGGYCRVAPDAPAEVSRRYLDDTNVLETTFETPRGVLVVTDALVLGRQNGQERRETRAARMVPHGQLVRRLEVTEGQVPVRLEIHPRFDYGMTSCHLRVLDDGSALALGGGDAVLIHAELGLEQDDWQTAHARDVLEQGDERFVSLTYAVPHEVGTTSLDREQVAGRLDETVEIWRGWAGRCEYDGPYRDAVVRSALTLKALTDARTGAIVAAATTSLPEEVGGVRNWDYRFTWIRDAAWHLNTLFRLGYEEEAHAFMAWLARTTAGTAKDLQVMYGNTGRRMMPEIDFTDLEGYRGSRPVRIGNGASSQFQLDLYGEIVSTAWHYRRHGGELSPELCHLLADVLVAVETRWKEPDKGLWEIRGAPEQFTSSKLYAWVAATRLRDLAEEDVVDVDPQRCEDLAGTIREHIERYGISEDRGHILRSFGQPGIDAANLLFALEGFFEPDDQRMTATVEVILEQLTGGDRTLVHRYRTDDGLSGGQSAFFWCSFWLVSVFVERGEIDRAREHFERLLDYRNDLGLLSEECDQETGELLGNLPQAISHVGLIDSALRLEDGADTPTPSPL